MTILRAWGPGGGSSSGLPPAAAAKLPGLLDAGTVGSQGYHRARVKNRKGATENATKSLFFLASPIFLNKYPRIAVTSLINFQSSEKIDCDKFASVLMKACSEDFQRSLL